MSWSTEALVHISFSRETYDTLYKVQSDIEECEQMIETAKNHLRDLAIMTEPNKFMEKGAECSPLGWVQVEFREWVEILEEETVKLFKLRCLEDAWNKMHIDGRAIYHKGNFDDAQRIWGDYLDECWPDGSKKYVNGVQYNEEGFVVGDMSGKIDPPMTEDAYKLMKAEEKKKYGL